MGQGKYERTPLTQARFKMSMTDRRIEKLKLQLAEAEQEKAGLKATIDELSGEAEHQHQLALVKAYRA